MRLTAISKMRSCGTTGVPGISVPLPKTIVVAKVLAKQAGLRHHAALDKIVQDEQGCANWQRPIKG